MKTFQSWLSLKENMTNGQSPVATGRQITPPIHYLKKPNATAAGLWQANGPLARLSYLSSIPNAKQLGLHRMDWEALPPEAQKAAEKDMNSPSPFGEQRRAENLTSAMNFHELEEILREAKAAAHSFRVRTVPVGRRNHFASGGLPGYRKVRWKALSYPKPLDSSDANTRASSLPGETVDTYVKRVGKDVKRPEGLSDDEWEKFQNQIDRM